MPETIAERLAADAERPQDAPVIHFRTRPVGSVANAWRKLRTRVGLDGQANTYCFRHTIARHLQAEGVPAWEVAAQLGHKIAEAIDRYAAFSPDDLPNATAAIDAFLSECV